MNSASIESSKFGPPLPSLTLIVLILYLQLVACLRKCSLHALPYFIVELGLFKDFLEGAEENKDELTSDSLISQIILGIYNLL